MLYHLGRHPLFLCQSILLLLCTSAREPSMVAMAVSSAVSTSMSALQVAKKCSPCSGVSASVSSPSTPAAKVGFSRRLVLPALVGAPLFLQQQAALAKDIPLFGLRKRVEEAEREVVQEVKELVKEGEELVVKGEKEISSVVAPAAAAAAAAAVAAPIIDSPPPLYQAGAVAGAELVAVLVASSVVNGLVSES